VGLDAPIGPGHGATDRQLGRVSVVGKVFDVDCHVASNGTGPRRPRAAQGAIRADRTHFLGTVHLRLQGDGNAGIGVADGVHHALVGERRIREVEDGLGAADVRLH